MVDRRAHRSAAPEDARAFGEAVVPRLREALGHLVWLANHGYEGTAALKLVGDRFALTARQRRALQRCLCTDAQRRVREQKRVAGDKLAGARLVVDGFNLLITLETALGGGVVLGARDGCLRDLAFLRGTWRRVQETSGALSLFGRVLIDARVAAVHVWLDRRVSNSGRLAAMVREAAAQWPFELTCEAATGVDARLEASPDVVVSADSAILDACSRWTNLARWTVARYVPDAWLVDLGALRR